MMATGFYLMRQLAGEAPNIPCNPPRQETFDGTRETNPQLILRLRGRKFPLYSSFLRNCLSKLGALNLLTRKDNTPA